MACYGRATIAATVVLIVAAVVVACTGSEQALPRQAMAGQIRDPLPFSAAHGASDSRELLLDALVAGEDCGKLLAPEVSEEAREVRVALALGKAEGQTCFGGGIPRQVRVALRQPLGGRVLVDAATGERHPVVGRDPIPSPGVLPPGVP